MYIPKWKRWLSHITEIHLESSHSEHNTSLHVSLSKGRLQLSTDNAIYSFADKYQNFYQAFEQVELGDDISDVLILGFGLGSIPYMLERNFRKSYRYTGVELDEEVIYLASKYVLGDLESDIHLIEVDAINFVHQNTQHYDLICMDIFVDNKIPPVFLEQSYLELLRDSLARDGKLIFNHLAYTEENAQEAKAYFDTIFKSVFAQGEYLQILGNAMLVGRRSDIL